MAQRCQVAIVGGGPVGIALAVELGLRGIGCTLIERRLSPQRIPKGQNLTARTLEHFHAWGIEQELRAKRVMPIGYPIGTVVAYENLLSDYWSASDDGTAAEPFYFTANERLPQYLTEGVLRERMAGLTSVTARFGWSAGTIEQSEDRVRIELAEADGEAFDVLEADYVVGCDGAGSTTREQAGIGRDGEDLDQTMVLAVFRSRELHERLTRFPERSTYLVLHPDLHGYWRFFGRVDVGEGFFFHAPAPPGATAADEIDVAELLADAAGFPVSCEVDHIGMWDMRVAVADRYRAGRVFIAGDAAHSHPPYGGFGLNAGLEDVRNLGWKLAAVLQGWGGLRLLDSYSLERQPAFRATGRIIIDTIRSDAAFLERYDPRRDEPEFRQAWDERQSRGTLRRSYAAQYEGSPVVDGPPGARCDMDGELAYAARPGHHLAPAPLPDGRNVFDALGAGLTLLAFGAEAAALGAFEHAARDIGAPLTTVRDAGGPRAAYGAPLILVRPDAYVAWVGDSGEGAAQALRTAVGRG